jgi:hypothetical protein
MAAAWAAASVTTCPAAVRVVSGGCPAEIGTVRPIFWSFRVAGGHAVSLPASYRAVWLLARGGDDGLSLAAAAPGQVPGGYHAR